MKLRQLLTVLPRAEVRGSREVRITGLANHSKAVAPGNLFVARPGKQTHGVHYITEALRAGASAILTDLVDPSLRTVTQIVVPDVVEAEGILAAAYYHFPSSELTVFGVTGTNGKSTVTHLIKQLWDQLHPRQLCGLIGTIEHDLGKEKICATSTTPDAITVQKLMREMRHAGCTACAIEITSHALDQRRCQMVEVDIALFTNLTQDHLDYHGTMEAYAKATSRLFCELGPRPPSPLKNLPKMAISWGDDSWEPAIVGACPYPCIRYGFGESCDWQISQVKVTPKGSSCLLTVGKDVLPLHTQLVGRFNLLNVVAALTAMVAAGHSLPLLLEKLPLLRAPRGRLEPVPCDQDRHVFVDFAHTPDALEQVCGTMRELCQGDLWVVFGAGGNRDRTKRPKMAEAVARYATHAVVTSDNPRLEDPLTIMNEVATGFPEGFPSHLIVDRREAIEFACRQLRPHDLLLIAGKGHESVQQIGTQYFPFQDSTVALQALGGNAVH